MSRGRGATRRPHDDRLVGGPDPDDETDDETADRPPKPFARLWATATIAYMAAVAAVFYLDSRGVWGGVLSLRSLWVALSPVCLSFGLRAIYTGEVSIKNSTFYRDERPALYWLEVTLLLGVGIALL